jgi:hypothetical protein
MQFFKGKVAETPAADELYSCSVGDALKKGTFCYAESASGQVALDGLDFNADYSIFAVAGSPSGNLGEVATLVFHTTDVVLPEPESASVEDGKLVITFSEEVGCMNKDITVEVYASYSLSYQDYSVAAEPVSTFTVKNGVADGTSVSFVIPEDSYTSGALLCISYPSGAFMDKASNPCEECESYVFGNFYDSESNGWYPETYGLVAKTEPDNFELGDALSEVIDENCYAVFDIGAEVGHYLYFKDYNIYRTFDWGDDYAVGEMVFTQESEDGRVSTKTIELPSASDYSSSCYDYDFDEEGNMLGLIYIIGDEPLPGDSIFVTIPEYAFVDVYNRPNAEKTYKFVYTPSEEEGEGDGEDAGTTSVRRAPRTIKKNFKRMVR